MTKIWRKKLPLVTSQVCRVSFLLKHIASIRSIYSCFKMITGDKYQITNSKEAAVEDNSTKKKKNFGGSGVTGGNLFKGIKNAKRFSN